LAPLAVRRVVAEMAVARPMASGIARTPPAATAAGMRKSARNVMPNAAARACAGLRRLVT